MFNYMRSVLRTGVCGCALAALALGGCAGRDEATVGTPANPLVVVLSPAHAPADGGDALAYLEKHLEAATGLAVSISLARTPEEAVNKFSSGLTDVGLLTLEEYLVAREEYGVRPELQVLRANKLGTYTGVILTKASGGAATVAGLEGKKMGFVGPYSLSGFTLPAVYLKKAGVKVQAQYFQGHEAVLKKLAAGEVYAAATYARQAYRLPGLKVLAVTGEVPNEPVAVRRNLAEDKRGAVKAAFLTLGDTPEGRRALGAIADITGFRPVNAQVYQATHELLRNEGTSVYELVPGGWDIYRLNLPYTPDR